MKLCRECGLNYEDHFDECPECAAASYVDGADLPAFGSPSPLHSEASRDQVADPDVPSVTNRPTGEIVIQGSCAALILGLFLALANDGFSTWFYIGLGLGNLGLVGLLAGYIVGAISFLPGKDD